MRKYKNTPFLFVPNYWLKSTQIIKTHQKIRFLYQSNSLESTYIFWAKVIRQNVHEIYLKKSYLPNFLFITCMVNIKLNEISLDQVSFSWIQPKLLFTYKIVLSSNPLQVQFWEIFKYVFHYLFIIYLCKVSCKYVRKIIFVRADLIAP